VANPEITLEFQDSVSVVTLNRPSALNTMTTNLIEELFSVLKRVRNDTRALVLTGNGQTFCAGGDIRDMQSIGLLESRPEAFFDALPASLTRMRVTHT